MFLGTVAGVVAEFSLGGMAFSPGDDFAVHDHDTPVIFVWMKRWEEPFVFGRPAIFFK